MNDRDLEHDKLKFETFTVVEAAAGIAAITAVVALAFLLRAPVRPDTSVRDHAFAECVDGVTKGASRRFLRETPTSDIREFCADWAAVQR